MVLKAYHLNCKCERNLKVEVDSDVPFVRVKCEDCNKLQLFKINEYFIIKHLGSGAMGSVYLAEDGDENKFALKIIENPDKSLLDHFMRECMVQIELDHKNITKLKGQGRYGCMYYIVMEYLEGNSLDQLLRKHGAFSSRNASKIILSVLSGLSYAAQNFKLVHRDIKPANIFLTTTNEVKILDLGLAKPEGESYGLTETGVIKGSPPYMPFEQFTGTKSVDARADVYALGATFYHLLCGQMPFYGLRKLTEIAVAKKKNKYIPLRQLKGDLAPELIQIVEKSMAFSPDDRYQSAEEMLEILLSVYNNLPR